MEPPRDLTVWALLGERGGAPSPPQPAGCTQEEPHPLRQALVGTQELTSWGASCCAELCIHAQEPLAAVVHATTCALFSIMEGTTRMSLVPPSAFGIGGGQLVWIRRPQSQRPLGSEGREPVASQCHLPWVPRAPA